MLRLLLRLTPEGDVREREGRDPGASPAVGGAEAEGQTPEAAPCRPDAPGRLRPVDSQGALVVLHRLAADDPPLASGTGGPQVDLQAREDRSPAARSGTRGPDRLARTNPRWGCTRIKGEL